MWLLNNKLYVYSSILILDDVEVDTSSYDAPISENAHRIPSGFSRKAQVLQGGKENIFSDLPYSALIQKDLAGAHNKVVVYLSLSWFNAHLTKQTMC